MGTEMHSFIQNLWEDYQRYTPDAPKIHALLQQRGEILVNDHVAFRTYGLPGLSKDELGQFFVQNGYQKAPEELHFPDKKLRASYFLPNDPTLPKVFISELMVECFPEELQTWAQGLAAQFRRRYPRIVAETFLGQSWGPIAYSDYQKFLAISEYAGWTGAFGIRCNHFTVLVNALKTFESLEALNTFLLQAGFQLSSSGGWIKGNPTEKLEQSSTQAQSIPWPFAGPTPAQPTTHSIPSCYYEFARRYPIHSGTTELFAGFLPQNATYIFDSTRGGTSG